MTFRVVTLALGATLALAGCASEPETIQPSYVSKYEYKDYSCTQLIDEAQRLSDKASDAYGVQKQQRKYDQANATVGAVIFWPTLFFIEGDGPKAVEVAHLKGQMDALEQASKQKHQAGCKITFTNR
jgi:hypothetical protein